MKTFTNKDIRDWKPCYDPSKKYPDEATVHTVLTILDDDNLSHADRMWVVLRTEILSDKLLRLFAVHCARAAIDENTDERCINAINVAERFANGLATESELNEAHSEAHSAANSAADSATNYAARYAASSAADYAASYAARSAASPAANHAAFAVVQASQRAHLRMMVVAEMQTGDVR